tara:strand:- start:780 stop:1022 length:243 start_codon:yes stop_codon:yes gene_type:complete
MNSLKPLFEHFARGWHIALLVLSAIAINQFYTQMEIKLAHSFAGALCSVLIFVYSVKGSKDWSNRLWGFASLIAALTFFI